MTPRVEFFFDLSSPWTCLAFHNLPAVLDGAGASARYRPILVGGVFNAVNPAVYAARAQADNRRMQHSWKVLADWARLAGVPMNFPSRWHPANSVAAMRFCCALEEDQAALARFARVAFAGYFDRREYLNDPAALAAIATAEGLDGAALAEAATSTTAKTRTRPNTDAVNTRHSHCPPTHLV